MKKLSLILLIIFTQIFCYGKDLEIGGVYKSDTCEITLKIENIKEENKTKYLYTMNSNAKDIEKGHISIIKDGEQTYLKFNNFEGLYEEDNIIIQNYGNSMNNFKYFKNCDSKYLEFIKE